MAFMGANRTPSFRLAHASAEPEHPGPAQRLGSGCLGGQRLMHAPRTRKGRRPAGLRRIQGHPGPRRGSTLSGHHHLASAAARQRPHRSGAAAGIAGGPGCRRANAGVFAMGASGACRGSLGRAQCPSRQHKPQRWPDPRDAIEYTASGTFPALGQAMYGHRARGTATPRGRTSRATETPRLRTPCRWIAELAPCGAESNAGGTPPGVRPVARRAARESTHRDQKTMLR